MFYLQQSPYRVSHTLVLVILMPFEHEVRS